MVTSFMNDGDALRGHIALPSFLIIAILLFASFASGSAITSSDAVGVASSWLVLSDDALASGLRGCSVSSVRPVVSGRSGSALCYVVELSPSGFVVVSGDGRLEPVPAFGSGGGGVSDPSQFLDLLGADLAARLAVADRVASERGGAVTSPAIASKWDLLLNGASVRGLANPGDIRVSPLVTSKWGQLTARNPSTGRYEACYNYYCPTGPGNWRAGIASNYPSGCVATAIAQLFRYWEWPSAGVGTREFEVKVDNEPEMRALLGGDGQGGPYQWDAMPLEPAATSGLSASQRQAIGRLCHDVAVSMGTSFSQSVSFASYGEYVFTDTFDYAHAVCLSVSGIGTDGLTTMLNSNLDAGCPVVVAMQGTYFMHNVIADGYGYHMGTPYHHINMGWDGYADLWYNLPDVYVTDLYDFNLLTWITCNVFPSQTGEIVSGRVTDSMGAPVEGAVLTAGGMTAQTNARGIYAFRGWPSNTALEITVSREGYPPQQRTVETGLSRANDHVGNVWGADFTLFSLADALSVRFNGLPIESGDATPSEADGTHFGEAAWRSGGMVSRTFTLRNDGGVPVDLGPFPVSVSPGAAFAVAAQPGVSTLQPGEQTSFTVRFAPVATGWADASVAVAGSASERDSYTFAVSGLGVDAAGTTILRVRAGALGRGDGSSWTDAFPDLSTALDAAPAGSELWIAEGTYTPGGGVDRYASFSLASHVALYGGFSGVETERDARSPSDHLSILSGNVGDPLVVQDNSSSVLRAEGVEDIVLDGLVVTGGYGGEAHDGGGLHVSDAIVSVVNCEFRDNAGRSGGAVWAGAGSTVSIEASHFVDNAAVEYGGALSVDGASATVGRCLLIENRAAFGGAVAAVAPSALSQLVNSVVAGNRALNAGGAVYIAGAGSGLELVHATVAGNDAPTATGLFCGDGGQANVDSCIMWGETPFSSIAAEGTVVVRSSCVQGSGGSGAQWNSSFGIDGGGNIDTDPLFGAPTSIEGSDGAFATVDDGLMPDGDSPCVDAAGGVRPAAVDVTGATRPQGAADDMGAYERPALSAPDVSVVDLTNDATPTWSWSVVVPGEAYRVKLDDATAWTEVDAAEYTPAGALSEGIHVLSVQRRPAGDPLWSPSGAAWVAVDLTAPDAHVEYAPAVWTNGTVTATLTLSDGFATDVSGGTVEFTANGTHRFEFADYAGNTGFVDAAVTWIDTEAPVLSVTPPEVEVFCLSAAPEILSGVSAWDTSAGDLSEEIAVSGSVDMSVPGSYEVVYTVTDPAGNVSAPATRTYVVVRSPQTIDFEPLSSVVYGDGPFVISASATSGLPVSLVSLDENIARVEGSTVVVVGAGTARIEAAQAGDAQYEAAASVIRQLTVQRRQLTIAGPILSRQYGRPNPEFEPTSSGLAAGDALDTIGLHVDMVCAADESSPPGAYPISVSGPDQVENYEVTYTDGVLTVTNNAPFVAVPLPDVRILQGRISELTVPPGTFEDADADDIMVLDATGQGQEALPIWLAFDSQSSTFTATPGPADVGSVTIAVWAYDEAMASACSTFELTVVGTNTAPSLEGLELTLIEDEVIASPVGWEDVDGDAQQVDFEWWINGVAAPEITGAVLPLQRVDERDVIQCRATPTDGIDAGAEVASTLGAILEVRQGWNCFSIPIQPVAEDGIGALLAGLRDGDAYGPVWGWRKDRYYAADTLVAGEAYWIFRTQAGSAWVLVSGEPVENHLRELSAGWHLLGPTGLADECVPRAADDSPIPLLRFWGWDGIEYTSVPDGLERCRGYWFFAHGAETVRLQLDTYRRAP